MDIEPQPQRFKKIYTPNKVPPTCAALYKKIVQVKINIYGKKHKQTDWETTMYRNGIFNDQALAYELIQYGTFG